MNNGDLDAKGILSCILYSEGTIESFKVGFSFSFSCLFFSRKTILYHQFTWLLLLEMISVYLVVSGTVDIVYSVISATVDILTSHLCAFYIQYQSLGVLKKKVMIWLL